MQFILTTGKHVYNDSQSSSTTTSCLIKIYYKTSTIRKRDFLKRNNSDHISFSSFSRLVDPEIKSALLVCIFPKKKKSEIDAFEVFFGLYKRNIAACTPQCNIRPFKMKLKSKEIQNSWNSEKKKANEQPLQISKDISSFYDYNKFEVAPEWTFSLF